MIMDDLNEIKINNYTIVNKALFKIHKYDNYEEMIISGYDMGNRIRIVKYLSYNALIVKVPSCKVLCGARGCGMVFPFPTKYYLARILDGKLPEGWNNWKGYIKFSHEMECGRKWKDGIKMLENIYNENKY
jgi:hypothetical protein